jgi:hypothetical protein
MSAAPSTGGSANARSCAIRRASARIVVVDHDGAASMPRTRRRHARRAHQLEVLAASGEPHVVRRLAHEQVRARASTTSASTTA